MVVMILERAPPSVRGELTRWLLEPYPGVFVGHVNAMVRERLWQKCCKARGVKGVVQLWSTNTEQRFDLRMHADTRRSIAESEGIKLIRIHEIPDKE